MKFIYWFPRILGIIFILFLMLFSFDSTSVVGFIIHNIPALILLIILAISWKYEIVDGISFILAGFLYILMLIGSSNFEWYIVSWSLIIAGPAFLIGILFTLNWYKKSDTMKTWRKRKKK